MKAIVSPGQVSGQLSAPPSKSYGQRALAAALIKPGQTLIQNLGNSADEQAALRVLEQLGAEVKRTPAGLEVFSEGVRPVSGEINCGESGLCARLFLPIAALSEKPVTITGSGTLLHRPMQDILAVLPQLGVRVAGVSGSLPVTVQGPLQPKDVSMEGSLSSQFLSGLLFAAAAAAQQPVQVRVNNLQSRGYAAMSVEVLQAFGYQVTHQADDVFVIHLAAALPQRLTYVVPGDFSSAAALMLAAALAGSLSLHQLQLNSLQPDAQFTRILQDARALVVEEEHVLTVKKAASLQAFSFDATHAPDLFPVLAILATQCKGKSSIKGLHRLLHKESNRAASIGAMLQQFGVPYEMKEDCLLVEGPCILKAATIDAFNDHRIVMAAAAGALVAKGPVTVSGAEAVRKSYPGFFEDMVSAGAQVALYP